MIKVTINWLIESDYESDFFISDLNVNNFKLWYIIKVLSMIKDDSRTK